MKIPFFFTFSCLLFFGCDDPSPGTTEQESPVLTTDGTAKMVKRLAEIHGKMDPMSLEYFNNSIRAEKFREAMESAQDMSAKMSNKIRYGYELIGAGKNEEAIVQFEALLNAANQPNAPVNASFKYTLQKMLALAYMRLGEELNCINQYNAQSCIMPIEGTGVYRMTQPSLTAIGIYQQMLTAKPTDYEAMWMLNFAYMTLGTYPAAVPAQWLIPATAFQSDHAIPTFKNIANQAGIGTIGLSGGACVDDFNNDGLLDIFASSWGANDQLKFYLNNGDGTFTDQTASAGITGLTGGLNIQHADYDNDGWTDLLVLRGAWYKQFGGVPNSLLRNNGDGTFSDVTEEAGLLSYAPTQVGVWADFDNNGWLDLFIGNESGSDYQNLSEFYFSNGDGTFTNKANELGLGKLVTFIKGAAAGDIDNDGWPDLYLSIQGGNNILLKNNGLKPDGQTLSLGNLSGISKTERPLVSFPCWMFDFNNDGWEDILAAGFGERQGRVAAHLAAMNYKGEITEGLTALYINNKNGTFTDIAQQAGMDESMFVMGSNYGDIDNDGWMDLYLGTGAPGFTAIVPNKMFRNNQGKSLQDVTTAGGFGHIQKGHGVGFGDFDNDGDQDIFAVIGGAFEGDVFSDAFFLNPMGNEKKWINLQLVGTTSNRSAIGARVKVTTLSPTGKERDIYQTVSTGSSFGGNSLQLEIGLDDAVKIKSITVTWPNRARTKQVFQNIPIQQFIKITEGQAEVESINRKQFSFDS